MMDILIWVGKVSLYWVFFYGCFYFFLRKLTHLRWNRLYLLVTLVLSLFLPFVQVPESASDPLVVYANQIDVIGIVPADTTGIFSWWLFLGLFYGAGVTFMAFRLISRLVRLQRLWEEGTLVELEEEGVRLYLFSDDKIKTFSFLNRIGLSYSDYNGHFDEILTHEMTHVRQRHSVDILLVELLRIFFWFHPVLPFYKKSLQQLHEFLADRHIGNRDSYAEFLVTYAFAPHQPALVNNFYSASLLKQRIQMMYKKQSPVWKYGFYVVTVLMGLGMMIVVAACSDKTKETELAGVSPGSTDSVNPERIFTAVEQNPHFPGGAKALFDYIAANIKYPSAAQDAGIEGRVFLQFVVRTDGSIDDVQILKGIGFGCDTEAVRVVKSMPKWVAGKQSGAPVNVKYTLPINFQLSDEVVPAL